MTFRGIAQAHLPLVLLSAKAAAVWVLANYSYPADPTAEFSGRTGHTTGTWRTRVLARSLLAAVITGWIAGRSFSIGLWTLLLALSLPLVRSRIRSCWLAELEILGNLAYGLGFLALAHLMRVTSGPGPAPGFSSGQFATLLFVFAIALYLLRGGTHIVRGILEKGRILPARSATDVRIDIDEYNRGRIIGNLERLILLIFVSIQAWSGLAFLMAAKGLFRARDLEKKEFSEYFLVGTLISSLVAIAAGLLVLVVVRLLW